MTPTNIKDIVPSALSDLYKGGCIDHPCTTCLGRSLESAFKENIFEFKFNNLNIRKKSDKEIFEEALCKMDMNKVKKYDRIEVGGFSGGRIPFWVKAIRNLRRNDNNSPKLLIYLKERKYLDFELNFSKIYKYWIDNRLHEIELLDFMLYYDRFVPEDKKDYLLKKAKTILKNNYNLSLVETLACRNGII